MTKARPIPKKWRELFQLIPGYDPVSTAAPGDWFDAKEAERAIAFFPSCLTLIEGTTAGQPFKLERWQKAIVGCLFGWKRSDGSRRYRKSFLLVGRGNGKSPLAAGICLYCLFCDNEPGAQIYSAGADIMQAGILFRHASQMVRREHELDSRCKIHDSFKSITLTADPASVYRIVSSDAPGKHGYVPHLVVADEFHMWQGRDLWEAFLTAFAKKGRRQPLLLVITTSDYERESVCNEEQDYATKVRDGIVKDSTYLPVLYLPAADDDWKEEKTWEKANPNIDVTVDREALRTECQRAREQPALENAFKRFHLNMKTAAETRWLSTEAWNSCSGDAPYDEQTWTDDLRGQKCYAGLDLSATTDMTALVAYFPDTHRVMPWFWIPDATAEVLEQKYAVPFSAWSRDGCVEIVEGEVIDYEAVRQRVLWLRDTFDLRLLGCDPWNARQISTQLKEGDGVPVVEFRQGFVSMNEPSKVLEAWVASSELVHGDHPVMRWCASNVSVKTDPAGNIKPVKPDRKKTGLRIDGIVALVEAIGCSIAQVDPGASVYESRGVLVL